jgi:hypothetical protein
MDRPFDSLMDLPPLEAMTGSPSPRAAIALKPAKGMAAPIPVDPVLIGAGAAVAARSIARRLRGWKRYVGSVEAVCHAVLEDCWNGAFFAGSAGHFRQFWTRDLAMCTPALCRLGHRDRVLASWAWSMDRFERARRVTTTIFLRRYPRDVYAYACDSLPLLLWALKQADADHLIHRYRDLLAREIQRYYDTVFDPEIGLARTDGYFSAPRDCMTGRSTTFANTMVALLARLLDGESTLPNPFRGHDVAARLYAEHWTGDFFRDALDRSLPSGDANVWPFLVGIFNDSDMKRRAFATLESRGLTSPVPLRYFEKRLPDSELPVPRLFTPNYQGDPSWTQLGPLYLQLLRDVDPERMAGHRRRMGELIDRDRNYLELYEIDGNPYHGRAFLYHADEGMIWAALFLDLF